MFQELCLLEYWLCGSFPWCLVRIPLCTDQRAESDRDRWPGNHRANVDRPINSLPDLNVFGLREEKESTEERLNSLRSGTQEIPFLRGDVS